MRVLFFGYSSIGARALRALFRAGHEVGGVFTHPDAPGEKIWFESVAAIARERGVPVTLVAARPLGRGPGADCGAPPDCGAAGVAEIVRAGKRARADVIISASFRVLLPRCVLALARRGAFNLHGSLLPRYRGRAPLNWALVNGERETGMTLHHMSEEADAGDVVAQVRLEIGPDETAPELLRRLEDAAEAVLLSALPAIEEGCAPRLPQDPALCSTFGRRRPEDGRFEWSWPARRIHNLVRAVTRPFPGAFAEILPGAKGGGGRVPRAISVWRSRVREEDGLPALSPGETIPERTAAATTFLAGTGSGLLEVLEWSERP